MNKKPLYILKLGGSVITYKYKMGASIRKALLAKIAREFKAILKHGSFDLIMVHGSGAAGHQMALKYGLKSGTGKNTRKWKGSFTIQNANQRMNLILTEIFAKQGIRMVSMHTASTVVQDAGKIIDLDLGKIQEALRQNCIPMLYGEMVFDRKLGMSICSGDAIVSYLAKKLGAEKVFFASDVNGIFTKDPFKNKDAELVEKICLGKMKNGIKLSESHNVDVTDGIKGKIRKIKDLEKTAVKQVEIFNGLLEKNYKKAFLEKHFPHTTILL